MSQYAFEEVIRQVDMSETREGITEWGFHLCYIYVPGPLLGPEIAT